jgi:hypothetical protein
MAVAFTKKGLNMKVKVKHQGGNSMLGEGTKQWTRLTKRTVGRQNEW